MFTICLYVLPLCWTGSRVWPQIKNRQDHVILRKINDAKPKVQSKEIEFLGGQWKPRHYWLFQCRLLVTLVSMGRQHFIGLTL